MDEERFAQVRDLETRWRPLGEAEKLRAEALLADATALIKDSIRGWESSSEQSRKAVVCAMVKRAMLADIDQAPLASQQTGAGPFQESFAYANPTGDLYLTSADRQRLTGSAGSKAHNYDLLEPSA